MYLPISDSTQWLLLRVADYNFHDLEFAERPFGLPKTRALLLFLEPEAKPPD